METSFSPAQHDLAPTLPMKIISTTLLAIIAITLTATASPSLRIETTVATADERVLARPTVIIPSGELGSIISGSEGERFTYNVRPTLLENGKVDIQFVITNRKGKTTDKLARQIIVPLGKVVRIQGANLIYTARPTLEKLPWESFRH